jgi:hypothetical protein
VIKRRMAGPTPRRSFRSDSAGEGTDVLKQVALDRVRSSGHIRIMYSQFMMGLSVAGVASCLLVTTFGLFHVDVFLRVYNLPLEAYSRGNMIFAVVNTVNDFLGAWLLDSLASQSMDRSDLIGISGTLFALCFMVPFNRWSETSPWDGAHFVISLSLYDTMCSFTTILLGSMVTDNHQMNDRERIRFMASGQIANLVAAFVVARIGLAFFDEENMTNFRAFLFVLAVVVTGLFLIAQIMTRCIVDCTTFRIRPVNKAAAQAIRSTQRLRFVQVVRDFWSHENFWAWIGMELFLESQVSFLNSFLKTFVDRLLLDSGEVSRDTCDWLLSIIRPLGLIASILCYIPIEKFGYRQLYPVLFAVNASLGLYMLLWPTYQSTFQIIIFLLVYPTITVAVSMAGFHLVMSDMVLEMKRKHTNEGRMDEPSLAAIYLGMTALFCKPAESFLPIIAANMLSDLNIHTEGDSRVQSVLYKVLVMPPLLFSVLEWLSWRRYTLTRQKTSLMRHELIGLPVRQQNLGGSHRHVS